jgi:hypothetical protein
MFLTEKKTFYIAKVRDMLGKWHKHLEKQLRLGIPLDEQGNDK